MEQLESLDGATSTGVAAGAVRSESVIARTERSPSTCTGTLVLRRLGCMIVMVFSGEH